MNASAITESEEIFERYLCSQKLRWDRVPTTAGKHPDYVVAHNGASCFFEVKEFDDPLKEACRRIQSMPRDKGENHSGEETVQEIPKPLLRSGAME